MRLRRMVSLLQRIQSELRRVREFPAPQSHPAHTNQRMRIIRINLKRPLVHPLRIPPPAQPQIQIGGLKEQPRPHHGRFFRAFQGLERFPIALFRDPYLRFEVIHNRGCLRLARFQTLHNAPHLFQHSERLRRDKQPHRKPLLIRVRRPQLAENLVRLPVPVAILIGFPQVVAQLADGLPHCHFAILIRPFDISQRDHLLQRFLRRHRVQAHMLRMASIRARNFFPAWNEPDLRRLNKCLGKHLAVHVFAHRQSVKRQAGWRDVQQRDTVEHLASLDAGPAHRENSVIAMLDGRSRRNIRN